MPYAPQEQREQLSHDNAVIRNFADAVSLTAKLAWSQKATRRQIPHPGETTEPKRCQVACKIIQLVTMAMDEKNDKRVSDHNPDLSIGEACLGEAITLLFALGEAYEMDVRGAVVDNLSRNI